MSTTQLILSIAVPLCSGGTLGVIAIQVRLHYQSKRLDKLTRDLVKEFRDPAVVVNVAILGAAQHSGLYPKQLNSS